MLSDKVAALATLLEEPIHIEHDLTDAAARQIETIEVDLLDHEPGDAQEGIETTRALHKVRHTA